MSVCKLQEARKKAAEEDQNRRIELNKADRDLNKKLAEEKKQEMEARKATEKVMDRAELEKMKESPFLNEIVADNVCTVVSLN